MTHRTPATAPAHPSHRSILLALASAIALGALGAGITFIAAELLAHWIEESPLTWHI